MAKRIFLMISLVLVALYLVAGFTVLNHKPTNLLCENIEVMVKDSVKNSFINSSSVASLLKRNRQFPVGMLMDSVDCRAIEQVLLENPYIESVECYKTPHGTLCVHVEQRIPILRVMNTAGQSYYVDQSGKVMPSASSPAHLIVATGHISEEFACKELFDFANLLRRDSFWRNQVQQINVTSTHELELVPRVGNHVLFLGSPVNLDKKLNRLETFYQKALNRVGWNKYSRISVEFDNQVICKRNE